jgi:hypothetical protein
MGTEDETVEGLKKQIASLRGELRESRGRVAELEGQLAESDNKAKTADTLAKQLEELKTKSAADADSWDQERAMYQAGITDPDAIDIAATLYNKLDPKSRPKTRAEWVAGFKDDPSKAPKGLQPYLPQAKPAEGKGGGGKAVEGKGAAKGVASKGTVAGGTERASGSNKYTPQDIRALRQRAVKTGNWDEYNNARDAIIGQVTGADAAPADGADA